MLLFQGPAFYEEKAEAVLTESCLVSAPKVRENQDMGAFAVFSFLHLPENSRRGFSVVEALIGLVIIGGVALGLSSFFRGVSKGTEKARLLSTMMALHSTVLAAVEEPDAGLTESVRNSLSNGVIPATFDLSHGDITLRGGPGTENVLDDEGHFCNPSLANDCAVKVVLGMELNAGKYRITYEIKPIGRYAGIASAPTANNLAGGALATSATVVIPQDVIDLSSDSVVANSQCMDNGVVGLLRGIHRSGASECISLNLTPCAPGEIAKGLAYDDVNYSVHLLCSPVRNISCRSTALLLQSFDPTLLDPSKSVAASSDPGKCVFEGADNIAAAPLIDPALGLGQQYSCPRVSAAVKPWADPVDVGGQMTCQLQGAFVDSTPVYVTPSIIGPTPAGSSASGGTP